MTDLPRLALWLATAMGGLALLVLLGLMVRRGVSWVLEQRLDRHVRRISELLREHEQAEDASMDRLLFQLGEVTHRRAVEIALERRLDTGAGARRPRLRKIYDSLGLTQAYIRRFREAPRWTDRAAAARALGQLRVVEAVPALVEALRDPHEDARTVKVAAAQALGDMQAEEAIGPLLSELRHRDDLASPRIAELLVAFGSQAVPPLVDALADESSNARVWAAQILGRIGDPAACQPLLPRLRDPSERVRISAAEALGRLKARSAVMDLAQVALRDPVPPVRAEAARALGAIGDEVVLDHLVLALGDTDYWTRLRAVEAIELLRPKDIGVLERALSDPAEPVRQRVAVALERLGVVDRMVSDLADLDRRRSDRAAETLVRLGQAGFPAALLSHLHHESLRVRARLCGVLGRIGDLRALDALVERLTDESWPVRARAVEAIAALRPPDGLRHLLRALGDAEEMVRLAAVAAIRALGVSNDAGQLETVVHLVRNGNAEVRRGVIEAAGHRAVPAVDELLGDALVDPNPDVRLAAARAVGERANAVWTRRIIERLSDADNRVRAAAASALGAIGTPEAIDAVLAALSTRDPALRESVSDVLAGRGASDALRQVAPLTADGSVEAALALVWTLGKTRDPAVLDALVELARHASDRVRASVAGAVVKIPGDRVVGLLQDLAADPNERVRAAAVNGLGAVGGTGSGSLLQARLSDPDRFVRNRVAVALGRIGGPSALRALQELWAASADPRARAQVVIGLGLHPDPEAFGAALGHLTDAGVRQQVLDQLGREALDVATAFAANLQLEVPAGRPAASDLDPAALARSYADVLAQDRNVERRRAAVRGLAVLDREAQREHLLRAARSDPDAAVRRLAVEALADAPDASSSPALAAALQDPSGEVRLAAIHAVGGRGDPATNRALLRCFTLGDAAVDAAVVDVLARANSARPGPFIDELMGFREPEIHAGGARTLGAMGAPAGAGLLVVWMRNGTDAVRVASARALGLLGTVSARAALADALNDPTEAVRIAALDALAGLPGEAAAIASACSDPSVPVRLRVAEHAVGRLGAAGIPLAERLADDPEMGVRSAALVSLLRLGSAEATDGFLALMARQPPEVGALLRHLPAEDPAVAGLCRTASHAADPAVREGALRALRTLGQRVVGTLLGALADPAPQVRIEAIRAAVGLDVPEVVTALERLARDPEPQVREAVRRGRLTVVRA